MNLNRLFAALLIPLGLSLETSQQGISDFMENAPIGMNWVDGAGTILWANRAELEILGYDPEEYMGQNLMDFQVIGVAPQEQLSQRGASANENRSTIANIFQRLLNTGV